MKKLRENIFTAHIEKIFILIIGILSVWILLSTVVISPNKVNFQGRQIGANKVDSDVLKIAQVLSERISEKPSGALDYKPLVNSYYGFLENQLGDIDLIRTLPFPISASAAVNKPKYFIPQVPEPLDTVFGFIRAAAYIPKDKVDEKNPYSANKSEPNDLDLVTVEAKFDFVTLLNNFQDSFDSPNIMQQWRDEVLAKPVFGSVDLQRQQLNEDGWSKWIDVPRVKTDEYRQMLHEVRTSAVNAGGSIKINMLRFDKPEIRKAILQPKEYQIASAEEMWFPPSIHDMYLKYVKEMTAQQKYEEKAKREEEKDKKDTEKAREESAAKRERGSKTSKSGTSTPSPNMMMGAPTMAAPTPGGGGGGPATTTRSSRSDRSSKIRERKKETEKQVKRDFKVTLSDVMEEFEQITLSSEDDLNDWPDNITLWAYDDTVESGKKYRYRLRVGVFNPIAGTDSYADANDPRINDFMLWSDYSKPTEAVQVPLKIYFFPTNVQENSGAVTVEVAKYTMGYWYVDKFQVHQGETIGKLQPPKISPKDKKDNSEKEYKSVTKVKEPFIPEFIDYVTDAVMIDAEPVTGWDIINSKDNVYFDILYSYDFDKIERMATKKDFWSSDLQTAYADVVKSSKEPHKAFRDWGQSADMKLLSPYDTGSPTGPPPIFMGPPGMPPGMMAPPPPAPGG